MQGRTPDARPQKAASWHVSFIRPAAVLCQQGTSNFVLERYLLKPMRLFGHSGSGCTIILLRSMVQYRMLGRNSTHISIQKTHRPSLLLVDNLRMIQRL